MACIPRPAPTAKAQPMAWALGVLLLLGQAVPGVALGQERARPEYEVNDLWSEPAPGVRYLDRRTSVPMHAYAAVVDLRAEGVRVISTRFEERWVPVSEFAAAHADEGVAVAVNGGFWVGAQRPLGVAIGGGEPWPTSYLDETVGVFAIDDGGRAHLFAPGEPIDPELMASFTEAVSGRPALLRAGEIDVPGLDGFESSNDRAPRTAVGLDRTRRHLILVVVDGRQPASHGMTLYELARFMEELGATDAMNLDGGGSSAMVVPRLGGVVNVPARGRWEIAMDDVLSRWTRTRETDGGTEVWVHGREREVMNHLAVLAPRPSDPVVVGHGDALAVGLAPPVLPPRREPPLPPRFRLGQAREWLVWAVPAACALALVFALVRLHARRARANAGGPPRGSPRGRVELPPSRAADGSPDAV